VYSRQEGIDPVGACVGLRGIRIQNIVNELNGERIDVVQWDPDPARFVANALSPAQVHSVRILPDGTTGEVVVGDRQLSLAIGKEGQNARLAAKLTGLRIDIKSLSAVAGETEEEPTHQMTAEPEVMRETPIWEDLIEETPPAPAPVEEPQPERLVASQAPADQAPAPPAPVGRAPAQPGAVRFADEVVRPDVDRGGGAAPARGGGRRDRRGGPARETEEQARARRAAAARRGGGRRQLDEEIEEELEAVIDDEDFDMFNVRR
jgi:N utilization substance protein A